MNTKKIKKYENEMNQTALQIKALIEEHTKFYNLYDEEKDKILKDFEDKKSLAAYRETKHNEQLQEILNRGASAEMKKNHLKRIYKLQASNYRLACYEAVLPITMEILKKYEGRNLGEKTKEKIENELNEQIAPLSGWLGRGSSYEKPKLYISFRNTYKFNVIYAVGVFDLVDNKIKLSNEAPYLCDNVNHYFKNYEKVVNTEDKLKKDLEIAQQKYNQLRHEVERCGDYYNKDLYSDMRFMD